MSLLVTFAAVGRAAPPQQQVQASSVLAIGDSVMLGAQRCMEAYGYAVDALGSRRVQSVTGVLRDKDSLPADIIVHAGTNGGAKLAELRSVMEAIGPYRQVIWVTVQLPDNTGRYTFEDTTNHFIRSLPSLYPNAQVADWNALSDMHPEWTGGDGIHLTVAGCSGFAGMIDAAVRQAQHYVPMRPLLRSPVLSLPSSSTAGRAAGRPV